MKFYKYLSLSLICIYSCSKVDDTSSTPVIENQMTDSRDGQVYETITIGAQTWFAENLNYDTEDETSRCYKDDPANCFSYGRLYEGETAQTICPEGWHLASEDEWQALFDYLGGTEVAHVFLAPYGKQQDEPIGFNLLSGGRFFANFQFIAARGYYYTSTEGGLANSYKYMTFSPGESVSLNATASSAIMHSCRCIQDSSLSSGE